MIRVALIAGGFCAITAALVLLQPGGAPQRDAGAPSVTRADVDLTGIAQAPRPATEAAPAPAPQTGAAVAVASAIETAQARAALRTDNTTLAAVTDGVLSELGLPGARPQSAEAGQMQDMTRSALANINALRKTQAAGPAPQRLPELISQALREGQSDAYIDALLNEAANRGEVLVPKALVTSDGRVDTAVILADIVGRAKAAAEGSEATPKTPADIVVGGQGVEVRMVTKADGEAVQYRFYTVNRGDSLGAIAVRFYGDVTHFSAIYEANRGILSSPDKIRVGQRLVIPTI